MNVASFAAWHALGCDARSEVGRRGPQGFPEGRAATLEARWCAHRSV